MRKRGENNMLYMRRTRRYIKTMKRTTYLCFDVVRDVIVMEEGEESPQTDISTGAVRR